MSFLRVRLDWYGLLTNSTGLLTNSTTQRQSAINNNPEAPIMVYRYVYCESSIGQNQTDNMLYKRYAYRKDKKKI